MRKPVFFLFVALLCLVNTGNTYAQYRWEWGISSVPMHNTGFDAWASVTDDSMNVIVAGFTEIISGVSIAPYIVYGSDTVFNPAPHQQGIVVKADSSGHFRWAAGSQGADNWPYGICTDHAGNVYVFGSYYDNSSCSFGSVTLSNPSLYNMYYLVKYSPSGTVIWAQNVIGNTRTINAGAIGIDNENNIYITGSFDHGTATLGSYTLTNSSAIGDTFDIFVAKYNTSGTVLAASAYGGHMDDYPEAMTVSPIGTLYITGRYFSRSLIIAGHTLTDTLMYGAYPMSMPFIMKADSNTHTLWAKQQPKKVTVYSISLDAAEHILMAGQMDSTVILGTDTLVSAGNEDILVEKCDSSGNVLWAKRAGDVYAQEVWSIKADHNNNIWVAGGTHSIAADSISFDGHYLLVPSGCPDPSFLIKYSATGVYDTGFMMPSGGDDNLNILNCGNNAMYLVGDYRDRPMIFGPDTLISFITSEEELFIARYKTDTVHGISDTSRTLDTRPLLIAPMNVVIAPNPASTLCTIYFPDQTTVNGTASFFDITGRLIAEYQLKEKTSTISLLDFEPGLYQCRITNGNMVINRKVVVLQ